MREVAVTPSPGCAGYSPDFAGESLLAPSPGCAGYSPDFAGESLLAPSPDFAGESSTRQLDRGLERAGPPQP